MKLQLYLIRQRDTELYSRGGDPPDWGPLRIAKIWTTRGAFVRHLQNAFKTLGFMPETWEVLEYSPSAPTNIILVKDFPLARIDGRPSGGGHKRSAFLKEFV
ncbi:MAG: hypothetical protein ABFD89_21975 [Bryobacteraceae bacterium]